MMKIVVLGETYPGMNGSIRLVDIGFANTASKPEECE
jgi:hypothetical protein